MKRIVTWIMVLILCFSAIVTNGLEIKAAEDLEYIDGSYLLNEEESEGAALLKTKGIYLGSGLSSIKKMGTGKIAAGGNTIGQTTVDKISITVEVQRLVDGRWKTYTMWSATNYCAPSVSTSKVLNVPTGYYYRVYCIHSANSDSSGSFTNGIYI